MTDFFVAVASSVVLYGVLRGTYLIGRRREAKASLSRLVPAAPRHAQSKEPWLGGFAQMLEKTTTGSHLKTYAARVHPNFIYSDVVALVLASMVGGGVIGGLLIGGSPPVMLFVLGGPIVLDRILIKLAGRRTGKLEQQLPEALHLQSSALKAGHSTSRSLAVLGSELRPPLGEEVMLAVREIELGNSMEHALESLTSRTGSKDVELWVTAMLVHRTTGGNLATILESLAASMRERIHVRAEVRALTAQGRLSGLVVALAPVAFFLLLSVTSRDQMSVLYTTPLGLALLLTGIAMEVVGFFWIRRILRIRA